MSIASTSEALAAHLRGRLEASGGLEGWTVEARTARDAAAGRDHGLVALVLWRVQPDEPPGGGDTPLRAASKGDPPDGTGLKLRYLLLVRGTTAAEEQAMLDRCLAALDRNPVVGDSGAPGGLSAEALVVAVEALPDEAYLRLMDLCGGAPALLVPYAVRAVPLLPPAAGRVPERPEGSVD
jgi:Pvc16 N-terminal domain